MEKESRSAPFYQLQNLTDSHEEPAGNERDKLGRTFDSASSTRHAYEAKTDVHEKQKDNFIQKISHRVIHLYQEKQYDKVFLVCPPKVMGVVRSDLSSFFEGLPLNQKVTVIEILKDLTHHTLKEIEEHIADASSAL